MSDAFKEGGRDNKDSLQTLRNRAMVTWMNKQLHVGADQSREFLTLVRFTHTEDPWNSYLWLETLSSSPPLVSIIIVYEMPDDDPEVSKVVEDHLLNREKWWRNRCQYLESVGYRLRSRYQPDWRPSWIGTGRKPRDFEDGFASGVRRF